MKKEKKKSAPPAEQQGPVSRALRRSLPLLIVLVLVGVAAAYFFDLLPENVTGLLIAVAVVLAACGYAAYALLGSTRLSAVVVLGVVGLGAIVALIPVVSTLTPGTPLAQGQLFAAGQSLPLPAAARGHVRLLLRGNFGTLSQASVDIVLAAGAEQIYGHLDRIMTQARVGRRGSAMVSEEHNSQYTSGVIPAGVRALTLGDLRGNLPGGLEVRVFHEWVPFLPECIAAAILLLVAAALAGRQRAGVPATAALAIAIMFGIGIYRMATPDAAVRSELGALLFGAVLGGAGGGTLGWIGGKILGRKSTAR
jgi:hypothetical protein